MPAETGDPAKRLYPPEKGVTVRMYNTGFGDCFLLAFPGEDGNPRYVLIDFGVLDGSSKARERMKAIAGDIGLATDYHLHVVAVTHEHADHINGFDIGKDIIQPVVIHELWLAWTEDPENPVARELLRLYGKEIQALKAAIDKLKAAGSPYAEKLAGMSGFDLGVNATDDVRDSTRILNNLREKSVKKPERPEDYKNPRNGPFGIPGVRGVQCYVLGPPECVESIRSLTAKKETYFAPAPINEETALVSAILETSIADIAGDSEEISGYPFDEKYALSPDRAQTEWGDFFREYYGFDDGKAQGPRWRRIDSDWLEEGATQIVLRTGGMINNTSLALAFALTDTTPAKVLLFAGDAQVGNWLSWQKTGWEQEGDTGTVTVKGSDLIRQTVLYKVGHHGSANATLREKGLEMMESTDLVAMLSVDQEWAERQDWPHPDPKLLARLMQKTRERVIRSDQIPDGDSFPEPKEYTDPDREAFRKNLEWDKGPDKLWIQYTVR